MRMVSQLPHQRAQVDDMLYGRDIEGPAIIRAQYDSTAAGKPTSLLNASFSGYDYKQSRLDNHSRAFMMDDYGHVGRVARGQPPSSSSLVSDSCWELLRHRGGSSQFVPPQGLQQTKFHSGFIRKQEPYIQQDVARKEAELRKGERADRILEERRGRLGELQSFGYNGYDIITGREIDPAKNRGRRRERRHVPDLSQSGDPLAGADTSGGRLRDSTSRFFCTADLLPHRSNREQTLQNDGLTSTQRTSTLIGLGPNPAQEIVSIGVREALGDSLWGARRRREADVALVAALK